MMSTGRTTASFFVALIVGSRLESAAAFSLRRAKDSRSGLTLSSADLGVSFEILSETHINFEEASECLCPLGQFWHWRLRACIQQGPWGYECGFFPKEHHHRVCQDGLKCEPLKNTKNEYFHDGAVPASCVACTAEDKCLVGQARQDAECLKVQTLNGEACSEVKVTKTGITASAEVTQKHTAEDSATHTAEETAEATATSEASAKAEATKQVTESATEEATESATGSEAGIKVESTASAEATEKATAEATASATGQGKATRTEEATASATHEASSKSTKKASASATATAKGVSQNKACVSVEEAKKMLEIESNVGAVLAAKVISAADKEAFERAYKLALLEAAKTGLASAEQLAKELAAQKAAEEAKLAAEAAAAEKAAWKAEAGASEKAKAAAKEDAQAAASKSAQEAAQAEASNAAKNAAGAEAEADASASAEAQASSSAEAKASAAAEAEAATTAEAAADEASGNVAEASHPPPKVKGSKRPKADTEEKIVPKHMTPGDVAAAEP